ncbi:MAG: aldo/keto reductase [Vicinamibacteraceae bacterium]
METRTLGTQGLVVPAIGLGCMGMSEFYGPHDEQEAIATIHRALELGVTMFDTADMYGPYANEILVGRALRGRRRDALIATKFGIVRTDDPTYRGVCGRPDYVRKSCEGSLQRLGVDEIDLYYQHRVDPDVPIEETVGAMGRLVEEGKVRFLGLSEPGIESVRRAHAVHPISAIQNEYSLWSRDPEDEVLPLCRELAIGLVAYSPLGRGVLAGEIRSVEDFAPDDYRRAAPRYQGKNFQKNLDLVDKIRALAQGKGVTPAQLALRWVLEQGTDIVPIPGTKRRSYLEQNVAAMDVPVSAQDLEEIEALCPVGAVAGARYTEAMMRFVGR